MATVTATAQAYQSGETTSSALIGYSYAVIRTVRYQFTTGSDGASSISFSFQGPTNPSGNSTAASINWYVTTSSTSHAGATASSEKNGTCSTSYDSSTYAWTISVTSGSVKLLPNTTYYLWLFPNHSTNNYYLTINTSWATSMSITLDGEYKPYTLTFSIGTGTSLTVTKSGSTLSSGATVYTGDVITVTYSASTGYTNATCSVSNVGTVSSGKTFTVSTNHTITTSATVLSYSLSISAGTGSTITVNRTSSPLQGATTGNLSNGSTIYYNDVLKITFSAKTGYSLATHTVDGSSFTSGNTKTVTAAVSVASTATVKSYTLSITTDEHTTVLINRTSSPLKGASTGNISNGAVIYYNDVLAITVTSNSGYKVKSAMLNDSNLVSPHTVTGNVTIIVTSSALGFVYIANSSGTISPYIIYVGSTDGLSLERYRVYIGTENNEIVSY